MASPRSRCDRRITVGCANRRSRLWPRGRSVKMMKGNSGRVAVVTGGGGGIGRGICLRLAGEEGVSVVVADQNLDKAQETVSEVEAQQGAARAFAVDVTNPDG